MILVVLLAIFAPALALIGNGVNGSIGAGLGLLAGAAIAVGIDYWAETRP